MHIYIYTDGILTGDRPVFIGMSMIHEGLCDKFSSGLHPGDVQGINIRIVQESGSGHLLGKMFHSVSHPQDI